MQKNRIALSRYGLHDSSTQGACKTQCKGAGLSNVYSADRLHDAHG